MTVRAGDAPARTRAFAAVYAVAALQTLAQTTTGFVVPVYVTDAVPPPTHFVVHLAVFSAPWAGGFLLAHLVGVLVDLSGRVRPFVLAALVAHLAGFAAMAASQRPWVILSGAGLAVSFSVTLNTTLKTYVTRMSEESKGRGVALMVLASQVGWLVGAALAAWLFRDARPSSAHALIEWDLALMAAVLVLVAVLLPQIGEVAGPVGARDTSGVVAGIGHELRALYSDSALVRIAVAAFFLVGGNWVFVSTYSVYLVGQLGAAREWIGIVSGLATFIASAILPFLGRVSDRWGARTAIRIAGIGYFSVYVLLSLFPSVAIATIVFGVPAYALLLVGLTSAAADIGGIARRGGGIGIIDGLWAIAVAAGAGLGGLVADLRLAAIPQVALALVAMGLALAWTASARLDQRLLAPAV